MAESDDQQKPEQTPVGQPAVAEPSLDNPSSALEWGTTAGASLRFLASLLMAWEVVGAGSSVLFACGVGALFGDEYVIARFLFLVAIVWMAVALTTWEETRKHQGKNILISLYISTSILALVLSLLWVRHRAQTVKPSSSLVATQMQTPFPATKEEAPITKNAEQNEPTKTTHPKHNLARTPAHPSNEAPVGSPQVGAVLPPRSQTLAVGAVQSAPGPMTQPSAAPVHPNPNPLIPAVDECPPNGKLALGWSLHVDPSDPQYLGFDVKIGNANIPGSYPLPDPIRDRDMPTIRLDDKQFGAQFDKQKAAAAELFAFMTPQIPKSKPVPSAYGPVEVHQVVGHITRFWLVDPSTITLRWGNLTNTRVRVEPGQLPFVIADLPNNIQGDIRMFDSFSRFQADLWCVKAYHDAVTPP